MKYFIITLIFSLMSAFPLISQHYLPIDREGVKWVNEKVIVDHGDTTCYYYNYEIKGEYLCMICIQSLTLMNIRRTF